MATAEYAAQLNEKLGALASFGDKEMVERPEGGTQVTFRAASAHIESAISIARDLLDMPTEHLTNAAASNIANAVGPVVDALTQIDNFVMQGDVSRTRDQLVGTLHNAADELTNQAAAWMSYLAYRRGDVSAHLDELRTSRDKANEIVDKAIDEANTKRQEIDAIIATARAAAGEAGVGTFNEEFKSEAAALDKASRKWMWLTSVGAIVTIGAAGTLYFVTDAPTNGWQLAGSLFTKLSVFSVGFGRCNAMVWPDV